MPTVPLTDPQIDLLLVLCQINRDLLEQRVLRTFSPEQAGMYGRVPTERDMKMMRELDLTVATIKVLKEAK